MRPERVSRYLACLRRRLGLIGIAIDDLDGPDDEDFAGIAGLGIHRPRGMEFPPDRLRQLLPMVRDPDRPRSPQFLRQQPSGLVGDAKLVLKLPRRHAVGMRCHEMCSPEPCRQRQPGTMHRCARRDRGLTAAIEAFI